jgi:Na+-transporting NADH:ubiquinone oxidoreductase subunit NqrE
VRLRWPRSGELLAAAGVICVVVALLEPWYQGPSGQLDAWDTFGPAVALLLAATSAALALIVATVTERTVALPVALAVWTVLLGLIAVIAAIVRVLERPQHSTGLCIGAWLALIGAVAILLGAWQALRDERPGRYEPASPDPRPGP